MRIVITKLGKKEFKEEGYDDFPADNILDNHNRIPRYMPNNNSNIYKTRVSNSIVPKFRNNIFPPLSPKKDINNINGYKEPSFLSKIGELSVKKQKIKTPNKKNDYLQLNKNNNNLNTIQSYKRNENNYINNNNNESIYKNIKISQKNLNIPSVIMEKFSKELMMRENENDIDNENILNSINKDEDLKISNTENNSSPIYKDKMYSLRELLSPKNQKKVDDSYLDKKININGGESIINYLQMDKTISPSLIKKINNSNNEQLFKLDKICKKYFNDEKNKEILDYEIKQKIKNEYEQDSLFCKNNLKNMSKDLKSYNNIYKRLRLKKNNFESNKNEYLSHIK